MTPHQLREVLDLAERNFAASQVVLAQMFAEGDGVEQDLGRARYWYGRASEQGIADATYHLGLMHLLGEGTVAEPALALALFNDAALQGSDDAHFLLGDAYSAGSLGLPKDGSMAARHYLEACACGGAARAIPSLGRLFADKKVAADTLAGLMCNFGSNGSGSQ